MSLEVHYDDEADVLYLAREGEEESVEEVYPGINLEMDAKNELIGIEILRASQLLNSVIEPLRQKAGGKGMRTWPAKG